jgi:LmbE family N-acetylglucosaminyl deacetylase
VEVEEVEADHHHLEEVAVECQAEVAVERQAEVGDSPVEEEEDHQEDSPLHKPLCQPRLRTDITEHLEERNHKSLTAHAAKVKYSCKNSTCGQTSMKTMNS